MRAFRATNIAARVSALALATSVAANEASGHTVSIGYEFAGPGAVNFWYGSYHPTATFNEADLQLTGPNINAIVAYTLLRNVKPAGLIDGVTNFYSNTAGTALVGSPEQVASTDGSGGSFNPATQSVLNWQGATFTGLAPGTYTFTYNPLGAPTVEWHPINDIIRTGTFTLTAADVLGIDGFASFAQNQNQNAVGTSLDNWINGGGFNQSFYDLAGLSPASLSGALTQLSGEVLTQGAPAAFQDMGAFLGGMLDPWGGASGMRGGDFGSGFGAGFGAASPAMAGSGAPYGSAPYGSPPYGGSYYGGYGGSYYGGSPYGGSPYAGTPYGGPSYATSPYGSAPYGGTPYGSAPYGGPAYGNSPYQGYGNAPYGNAPYGNSPYGNSPYGQSPYGPSPYGSGARNADGRGQPHARAYDHGRRCAPPAERRLPSPDPCWGAWMTTYGIYSSMDGNAETGSHNTTIRSGGMMAGLDYRFAPGGIAGVAISAATSRWGLAENLGSGRSEMLQGGAYMSYRVNAAYLSAAFAYARQSVSTDRLITLSAGGRLAADYDADGIGGRIEIGHRFGPPQFGVTPYAAFQVQRWSLPAYDETATTGANVFALSVAARTAADQRGELGLWADRLLDTRHGRLLVRGRVAWKHSWSELPVIDAAFQALPGSSFTVTGAGTSPDALAASLASELRIAGGWSVATKFDGEFAANSQSYGGSATLRYQW